MSVVQSFRAQGRFEFPLQILDAWIDALRVEVASEFFGVEPIDEMLECGGILFGQIDNAFGFLEMAIASSTEELRSITK